MDRTKILRLVRSCGEGNITEPYPWESEATEAKVVPQREPGDDSEDEEAAARKEHTKANKEPGKIDYGAEFARLQVEDPEGLSKACDEMGYGTDIVIPLSGTARQMLHAKYLELKKQ